MLRLCALLVLSMVLAISAPAPAAPDVAVVIDGTGAAHGMGLAMDGVLGQTRAGWKYRNVLGLFYPGTKLARASGEIRVGLAEGTEQVTDLPSGGEVSDAGPGEAPGDGFPMRIPAGGTVRVVWVGDAYRVRTAGLVHAAQVGDPVPIPTPFQPPGPLATPAPIVAPTPDPTREPGTGSGGSAERMTRREVWITPSGDPAVARLAATGRRYRGRIQMRWGGASLWAINHIDLESYVRGIAEEKGAGWPVEGLKVLAVAARSLGYATMQWYARSHQLGYDICATSRCQVYLGYDGEAADMTAATNATAHEVLVSGGRPILAMYHGNGGGKTDAYRLLYGDGSSDPYPYLTAVEYPFANPSHWQRLFTSAQVEAALRAAGIAVPGRLRDVVVQERGLSPRVRRVRVVGDRGGTETSGLRVATALGLPSTWFDVTVGGAAPASPDPIVATDAPAAGLVTLDSADETAADDSKVQTASALGAAANPIPLTATARRPNVLATAFLALALAFVALRRLVEP